MTSKTDSGEVTEKTTKKKNDDDTSEKATEKYLREMKLPEVEVFMEEFLPSYDKTLDELA